MVSFFIGHLLPATVAWVLLLGVSLKGQDTAGPWRLLAAMSSGTTPDQAALIERKLSNPGGRVCTFTMVLFDEKHYTMEVAANAAAGKAKTTAEFAKARGAVAACNGGYFEPTTMMPTGLEAAGGVRTGKLTSALPFGGLLAIENGRGRILGDDEFKDSPWILGLVQCSPRLVEEGRVIDGIGGANTAQRTFVATDGGGRWVTGICTSISLPDLAQCLCLPGLIEGFTVERALNLDGGPSSALWMQSAGGGTSHRRESWKVRNVLLVVPREGKSAATEPSAK